MPTKRPILSRRVSKPEKTTPRTTARERPAPAGGDHAAPIAPCARCGTVPATAGDFCAGCGAPLAAAAAMAFATPEIAPIFAGLAALLHYPDPADGGAGLAAELRALADRASEAAAAEHWTPDGGVEDLARAIDGIAVMINAVEELRHGGPLLAAPQSSEAAARWRDLQVMLTSISEEAARVRGEGNRARRMLSAWMSRRQPSGEIVRREDFAAGES